MYKLPFLFKGIVRASCQMISSYTQEDLLYTKSSDIFPDTWCKAPHFVSASLLTPVEAERAINIAKAALAKYPNAFLKKNLKRIHLVRELSMKGVDIAGLNHPKNRVIYINNNGSRSGYTNAKIAATIHHEFAHLLLEKYASRFSMECWLSLSPAGFKYGNGGFNAIKDRDDSNNMNENYLAQGFVRKYAQSEWTEDFACLSEGLFSGDANFWIAVDRYTIMRNKVSFAMRFFSSLDKTFTESYFRSLAPAT